MTDAEARLARTSKAMAKAYVDLIANALANAGGLPDREIGEALLVHAAEKLTAVDGVQATAQRLRALARQVERVN